MYQTSKEQDQIRKRESYKMWKGLYAFISQHDGVEDIMKEVYRMMDNNYSFGSVMKAGWSEESLNLLLQDMKPKNGGTLQ